MKEKDDRATAAPSPANENGPGREAVQEAERHLSTIARAIGHHIAREHVRIRERERRKRAANDNKDRSANDGRNAPARRLEARKPEREEPEPDE
ncbi:hypothetical protein [Hoeflea sp.]|uniref:hypothetical protein n=1 Tax=Hoeflea sp. TaxID=1940281 RepID=UPI003B022BE6